jgi:hypothetical protein
MGYLELANQKYADSLSKEESLGILNRYKTQLSTKEYDAIFASLCSHALEGIYLNEKDILLSVAQLRKEVTMEEIIEIAKAS